MPKALPEIPLCLRMRASELENEPASLQVAELYGKQHNHVLRAIKELQVSDLFRQSNFGFSEYQHPNQARKYPMYWMTRDGFWRLSMAFAPVLLARNVVDNPQASM